MESHGASRDVISVVTGCVVVVSCCDAISLENSGVLYHSLLSVLRPCYQPRMSGQCPTHYTSWDEVIGVISAYRARLLFGDSFYSQCSTP
jgi:predicted metal-binding protein